MATVQHEEIEISLASVSTAQREKNHTVLQPILTDLIAYARILKQLHWNVVGPSFRPVHLHLDEIYQVAEEATDVVAERLAAIGHSPDGRIPSVNAKTEIDDVPAGFLADAEVLSLAERRTKTMIELLRSRMSEIEEVDTVTADLLHTISADLEKHHWMLQAQRT